jgi:GH43 family beta-xylosidase
METKLFEVRDRGTLIPVIAIRLGAGNESERYLLARVGYGTTKEEQEDYVLYAGLEYFNMQGDPYKQTNRTRHVSHKYIREHWDELSSGDVIDVEFILGETTEKKESESHA